MKKLWVHHNWEWGDAAQSSTAIILKPFRNQIQALYMPVLWTAQLLRGLQAFNRKLFACMPEPKPQLWSSRIDPDLGCIQDRLHYPRIFCIFSRLICFLQEKNSYLTCMHISIWLSIYQYSNHLSEEGKCRTPSPEKLPLDQPWQTKNGKLQCGKQEIYFQTCLTLVQ